MAARKEFAVESEMPSGEAVIVIGRLAQKVMPVDLSSMGEEDFLIRTEKRDGRIVTGLYGRTGTAVLYAVSGYLERRSFVCRIFRRDRALLLKPEVVTVRLQMTLTRRF